MKDTARKELIGLDIVIHDAKNPCNKGIKGTIIDETRETITLQTEKGKKKLIKKNITIDIKKENIRINGSVLVGRPEDRIKKVIR